MANEIPEMKLYEPYRELIIKQEETLYQTFQTSLKSIKDTQAKLKNQKEMLLKEFKLRQKTLPDTQLLGSAYVKVFEGMGRNIQNELEYVTFTFYSLSLKSKKMDEICSNISRQQDEMEKRKKDITSVVNAHKSMKSYHQDFLSILKGPERTKLPRAENDFRNAKLTFENAEKNAVGGIKRLEREKVDSTTV